MKLSKIRTLGISVLLLSMSMLFTEHVLSNQIRTMEIASQSPSETVTHRIYAAKDADDRPTGTDGELRIGREWGSTECWLQFDLNSISRYSTVDNVTFWFYHTRTTYQENAIRMMGNDDWEWTEDGVDKPDGNWSTQALGWYDYGDAQMPPMWVGWNDTKTATMGLQYPFLYGPVTGHLTEYVNEILAQENRNFTLVLRNIWGDGAGGSHYHASRESGHVPYLEFVYLRTLSILDVDPDTLNLRSKSKWITAYIELPEGYDVNDVDVSTIWLNNTVQAELKPVKVGDYDGDGIFDLKVKFDTAEVMVLLSVGEVTLTITGEVNGIPFEGSDTIRVIGE